MAANFPALYDPQDVYRDYAPRAQEFMALGMQAGLPYAAQDGAGNALVIIDMQNDFVRPNGALSVPGAEDDVRRLIEFIYKNAATIKAIHLTMDTHYPEQIFFGEWWEDPRTHANPAPFTIITSADIRSGKWRARIDPVWSHAYVAELERLGRYALMIWPKHTMFGSWGHQLVPALYEAVVWHSAARQSQPRFYVKGDLPQTERYGAFAPEVEYPKSPRGRTDVDMLGILAKYKATYWAGEAETHCVLESQRQAVQFMQANSPAALSNMYFLMDCTSPITHPQIDFVGIARAEQKRMASLGVNLVKSTSPIK